MAYVYLHFRKDNNSVFYVGISDDSNYKRASDKKGRNKYWRNIVNKHGFEWKIIEDNLSWDEACIREKHWIKEYGRIDLNEGILVNMTDGGDGLNNPSLILKNYYCKLYSGKTFVERFGEHKAKEIGKKISEANSGQKRPKQSKAMKGRFKGNDYGKHQSSESRDKKRKRFLENNPNKNPSIKTRLKISKSKKGKPSKLKGIERRKITCPYCHKIGGEGLMHRWHFENCKFKNHGTK